MSRVNRNANYIFDIDGETVWERLRVIRNFLQDRRLALQIAELNNEKAEALSKESFEYREYMIMKPQQDEIIQDCKDEIFFLEEFEARLIEEAEKVRLPNTTDREMYELNFALEHKIKLVKKAQSEFLSMGRLPPDTIISLGRNKEAAKACVTLGILSENALQLPEIVNDLMGVPNLLESEIMLLERK